MIFEKLDGGTLLHNIWRRGLLREHDVSEVVKNIADGLFFLHQKGMMWYCTLDFCLYFTL